MVKLPRVRILRPRAWPKLSPLSSVRGRITAGFGLLVLILVTVTVGAAGLAQAHRSGLAEMEQHAATASLFEDAQTSRALALLVLQRHALIGDETAVPEIRSYVASVIDSVAEAGAQEGVRGDEQQIARLDEIMAAAAFLSDISEQVIALQQSGDVQRARAILAAEAHQIAQLESRLRAAADFERQQVVALGSRAATQSDLAFWLLVISAAIAGALALVVSTLIARSILRPLSSLESAALAVAGGDLKARAPVEGPRELARLSTSLNQMTESLLDASKRRQLEEALRESEEQYRGLYEEAPIAYYSVGLDGCIHRVNRCMEDLLGYARDDLVGQPVFQLYADTPAGKEKSQNMFLRFRAGEEIHGEELEMRKADGRSVYISLSAKPVRDAEGRVVESRAMAVDISERKRAEEELERLSRQNELILNSAGEGIYGLDLEGRTTFVNPAATALIGWEAEELADKPQHDILHHSRPDGTPYPKEDCPIYAAFKDGGVHHVGDEVFWRRDGTSFPVEYVSTPIRDAQGELVGAVVTFRDITERKQAEEALRSLNRELEKEQQEIEALNRSLDAKVKERTEELGLANEELQQRNRQLLDARAQAATDALTGLPNHRAFQERIRDEVSQAREKSTSVGLIMLDIDAFKRVNDSLGHLTGDQALRDLALALAGIVRREDAYRYGGDEFAVLLPGVDRRKTARVAERLRRAVERLTSGVDGQRVTVSLGLACFPDTAGSVEELIYGADAAMYWAKSAGKNRVGDWSSLVQQRTAGDLPWYGADRGVRAPDAITALVAALEAKDPITSAHTARCSWYALKLSEELGLSEEETSVVRLASLLHDIGKIAVPDEVLFKPGPLNEQEWAQMKQHPGAALHVLGHIRSITDATPAILHHHEHYDGSGYPDSLTGEEIPIASRILLVTDAFDAMTTDRPYRKAMPLEAAIEELNSNSGSQFDPSVVDAFLKVLSLHGAQPLCQTADDKETVAAGAASRKRPEPSRRKSAEP